MIYRLPPLNALRVFEAAARHLSFKEAANELSITQAAVSHQIKSLEDYLGVQLFKRAGRGVQLTEAARACLPKLREGFESLAAAVEMIHLRADETDLQITAPPVFTARWLMPRLADFAKREPKVDVRVVSSSKMVDAGALDHPAITSSFDLRSESSGVEIHLGAGDYPGHRADKLFGVSTIVVASPELVKGTPGLRAPADLANHTLLHDDAMDLVAHGHTPGRNGSTWPVSPTRWMARAGRISRATSFRSKPRRRSWVSRSRCGQWSMRISPPAAWSRRSRSRSRPSPPITLYALRSFPSGRRSWHSVSGCFHRR